jgi:hypothetical protein
VKKNIVKKVNKNKKLLAEVGVDAPVMGLEVYSEGVLDAMECAPTLGLTFGGDEKRLLNLFSIIEKDLCRKEGVFVSNTKGKSELKNWNAPSILRPKEVTCRVKGRVV